MELQIRGNKKIKISLMTDADLAKALKLAKKYRYGFATVQDANIEVLESEISKEILSRKKYQISADTFNQWGYKSDAGYKEIRKK